MGKKIYKYFSAEVLELIFKREGFVGIKCSLPNQYNDPYELFLGVDTRSSPDLLATYQEIVQNLPQLPTTCFSKSPTVTPMWAHYASNHTGFVLEFDVDALLEVFEEITVRDVVYKDAPDGSIQNCLQRVSVTKKPRHAVWLRQTVLSEAYFSKQTAWAYEQECRLVDFNEYVEEVLGNKILFVPLNCVTAIACGKNFPEGLLNRAKTLAETKGLNWFQAEVGKVQASPFFISVSGDTFSFLNGAISKTEFICVSCSEPVLEGVELCSWCAITDSDRLDAARGNPFRILDHYGILENYFEEVGKIEGRRNRRPKIT